MATKACRLCCSVFHYNCVCPNLQQVILANWYLEDPFYTTEVYREPAPPPIDELRSAILELSRAIGDLKKTVDEGFQSKRVLDEEEVHEEEVHTKEQSHVEVPIEPIVIPSEVMPIPIVVPTPPPFYVKAIPDEIVKDSLVFKCGVLAKWHVEEEAETKPPPPSYTEVKEEIHVFVYGGEGVKGGHARRKKSLDERGPSAKCFERSCPMRRVLNEWADEWSVHSGRFKLLG